MMCLQKGDNQDIVLYSIKNYVITQNFNNFKWLCYGMFSYD